MSDRYKIQEKIGQGGLGAVYRAFDTQLKREVALKRILTPEEANPDELDEAAEKLMQEATVMSSLSHPNIVTVYDVGQDETGVFVVMELLKDEKKQGETLDETVARGLMTLTDFSEVVNQTLEALIAAQDVNMLHRDLKPSNIMVIWRPSGKFQIKVLDFGLAKIADSPSVQTIDQGDAILGSIYFMAPEQFERQKLDARTDMYAMGAIYYFCLTGKYPFDGDSAPQVMAAHLQHKVKPLKEARPDLPDEVCQWVMWLINRDMKRRPKDAHEALERFPPIAGTASGPVAVSAAPPPQEEVVEAVLVDEAPTAGEPTGQLQTGAAPRVPITGPHTGPQTTVRKTPTGRTGGVPTTTTGHQVSPHSAAVELKHLEEERKKNRGILIGSLISGSIIIALGAFFMLGKLAEAKNAERFANLVDTLEGNAEDVGVIVHFLDPEHSDPRALTVLKQLEGPGVEKAILAALEEAAPGQARTYIIDTVASRNMQEAFGQVVRIFSSSTSAKERALAAKTLRAIAQKENFEDLLKLIQKPSLASADRRVLEEAVIAVLRLDGNVDQRAGPILNAMNRSTGELRKSLCRILGALGGKAAEARLQRIFNEEDQAYQYDALLALNAWPDRSALKMLGELIATSKDQAMKTAATRHYIRMLGMPGPNPVDTEGWLMAMGNASNSDRQRVLRLIADRPLPATIDFLKTNQFAGLEKLQEGLIVQLEKAIAEMRVVKSGEVLPASAGEVRGGSNGGFVNREGYLDGWRSPETWIQWKVKIPEPGTYKVEILQACDSSAGSQLEFYGPGGQLFGETRLTNGWDSFDAIPLGRKSEITIAADKSGPQILFLRAGKTVQKRIANIQGVRLTKK